MTNTSQPIEKNRNTDVIVSISNYKGKDYLNVREYFLDARNPGKHNPTRKGITLPVARGKELLVALTQVLGSNLVEKQEVAKPVEPVKAPKSTKTTTKSTKEKAQ